LDRGRHALFQLLNAVPAATARVPSTEQALRSSLLPLVWRRFSFAVVGKRNNGNRASANTAANISDHKSFKLKMCILLSYLFLPNLNDPAILSYAVRSHPLHAGRDRATVL